MKRVISFLAVWFVFGLCNLNATEASGYPSIWITPVGCQDISVVVSDSTPGDQGLADVELLFDPLGVSGHKLVSYNVAYDGGEPTFFPEDLTVSFKIRVLNPAKPAYAAIWAVNHLGQDVVYEYQFQPAGLFTNTDSVAFTNTMVGNDSCVTIALFNNSSTTLPLNGFIPPKNNRFTIDAITPDPTTQLDPQQTLTIRLCYHASDTAYVTDTIQVNIDCFHIPFPLSGQGQIPIIEADDAEINGIDRGESGCGNIRVSNRGKLDLVLTGTSAAPPFTIDPSQFPATIAPGDSHAFSLCFAPQDYGSYLSDIIWYTNLPAPFQHTDKDVSHVHAVSAPAGLHWDRLSASYDPSNGTSNLDTFHVRNTSSSARTLDSLEFSGQNAEDFFIQGIAPHEVSISAQQENPYTIIFEPNLFNDTVQRSAVVYIVSDGRRVDSLMLHGTTASLAVAAPNVQSGADFSVYPNPASGGILHVSSAHGTKLSNVELFDELGHTVWSGNPKSLEAFDIPTKGLAVGSYFLRVEISDANWSRTRAITKRVEIDR